MKIVATASGVAHAGDLIEWSDGVQIGPLGEELRVVPHTGALFTHSTWCSRDGTLYDRLYDPWARAFVWSESKSVALHPQTDHFQATIGCGAAARAVRLVRIIALAWVEAPRSLARLQACVLSGCMCEAESIVWVRSGVRECTLVSRDEVVPQAMPSLDEIWVPLRFVGRGTSHARVFRFTTAYEVSKCGWVRSLYGAVTKGIRAPDQRLWVSLEDIGLVWVDEVVLCSFFGFADEREDYSVSVMHINGDISDNAFSNLRWTYTLTHHEEAFDRTVHYIQQGSSIAHICALEGIRPSTAWGRVARVYEDGTHTHRQYVARLVPKSIVERCGESLEEHGVAMRLRALVDELEFNEDQQHVWYDLDDGTRMGLARLARDLALDAQMSSLEESIPLD